MSQAVCYTPGKFKNEELIWFGLCSVAKQVDQKAVFKGLPGVIRTWLFHFCGPVFIPWLGS